MSRGHVNLRYNPVDMCSEQKRKEWTADDRYTMSDDVVIIALESHMCSEQKRKEWTADDRYTMSDDVVIIALESR
ncbi:hypothetical protein J6590_062340 [Homalodisca vitripennis]|nr:hypothetical protein J6590_062340 [Homalodisca vitripennis]